VQQITINGECSKQQRNKKTFKILGWDIYMKRSFEIGMYKENKSDMDCRKAGSKNVN
jgi:hypothetical protein